MSSPYLGELRTVSFGFAPEGWALCNGQTLSIDQNQALFSLLGTAYGGDGQTTFALPNLQGRVPMHTDGDYPVGQVGGEESHTLDAAEASHSHTISAPASIDEETTNRPDGASLTAGASYDVTSNTTMGSTLTSTVGGGGAHENRQPSTVLNIVIALVGIFPTRS